MIAAALFSLLALDVMAPTPVFGETCQTVCLASAERVSDSVLSQMRGGVELPNGLTVAIGIDIQTRVDGILVLHTVYTSDGPSAGIRVFTDGVNSPNMASGATTVTSSASGGIPIVIVDRSPAGTAISPGRAVVATNINLVNSGPETWLTGEGQTPVPVTVNGPAIAVAPGEIRLERNAAGSSVILAAPTFEVRQLVGSATGVVVANVANNRAIETVSSINVDLRGVSPQLLEGSFAAQRMAVETMLVRAPGGS